MKLLHAQLGKSFLKCLFLSPHRYNVRTAYMLTSVITLKYMSFTNRKKLGAKEIVIGVLFDLGEV